MSLRDYLFHEEPGITLYCGDCREVLPLLDLSPVAVISDPPYGINYDPTGKAHANSFCREDRWTKADYIVGDGEPFDPSPLIAYERVALFGAKYYADRLPVGSWFVWDKRRFEYTNDFGDAELIWTNIGGPVRLIRHEWNGIIKDSERGLSRDHPTQKPIPVMEWLCRTVALPGDVVLDPYAGSGTTVVAAKNLGRRAIGIEIEPKYCEIAVKRLRQEGATISPMIGPRADFCCNSKKCRQEDGSAPVYELPVTAKACPVCSSKRLVRLFNAVNTAHGVAARTDKIVEPQYVQQQQRHDKAVETQRTSPMFAVPMSQLGATLAQFGGGVQAVAGTSRPTPGISDPMVAGVKAAGAVKPANIEWVNRRVDRNDQWRSTGGSGR